MFFLSSFDMLWNMHNVVNEIEIWNYLNKYVIIKINRKSCKNILKLYEVMEKTKEKLIIEKIIRICIEICVNEVLLNITIRYFCK